jgi:hypothetical protein
MALHYPIMEPAATAAIPTVVPTITGRFAAHTHLDRVSRAFLAADLHSGAKRLVRPTMTQCAAIARVNVSYCWWAERRMAERTAIESGAIPLVPAPVHKNSNGTVVPISPAGQMPDPALIDFVRNVGVTRVLEAACAVEAAE